MKPKTTAEMVQLLQRLDPGMQVQFMSDEWPTNEDRTVQLRLVDVVTEDGACVVKLTQRPTPRPGEPE